MNRVKVVTCTALIIFSLAIVAIQAQTLTGNKSDKQANNHTEVITQNEEGKVVKELNENIFDKSNDLYDWQYYNDGLDMDQQDERFWDF